jgi:hypothetical protein
VEAERKFDIKHGVACCGTAHVHVRVTGIVYGVADLGVFLGALYIELQATAISVKDDPEKPDEQSFHFDIPIECVEQVLAFFEERGEVEEIQDTGTSPCARVVGVLLFP